MKKSILFPIRLFHFRKVVFQTVTLLVMAFSILVTNSCQKDRTIQESLQSMSDETIVECRACSQLPVSSYTIPSTANLTDKRYKARWAVDAYRYYRKLKPLYSGTALSSTILQNNLCGTTLTSGEVTQINNALSAAYFYSGDGYQKTTKFLEFLYSKLSTVSTSMNKIYNCGNSWDGTSGSVGSYTNIHPHGSILWDYSGKGDLARARLSSQERCSSTNIYNSPNEYPASIGDQQPVDVAESNKDRQSFKEEAIRFWILGPAIRPSRTDTYNDIASPGVNYIIQDGY